MGITLERSEKKGEPNLEEQVFQTVGTMQRISGQMWVAQKTLLGKKTNKRTHLWADDEEEEADEDEND